MTTDLKNLKPDKVVDARGTSCPGPLLEAKRNIGQVPVGGVMEVLSSDAATVGNVKAWAEKMGHEFLGYMEESGYYRIFVRRRK